MKHPFLKNPSLLIWYLIFWIAVSVIQYFLECSAYDTNIGITLVDVIVSNALFSILGIGIWYVVLGSNDENKSQINMVI